jgi:hypothetical protein
MRQRWVILVPGILALVSTTADGACLPTLGTDDCFRGGDPVVQAIEHRYLDVPAWVRALSWSKRHRQVKWSPSSALKAS